jgi:YesN/AraC family two-component response regulator
VHITEGAGIREVNKNILPYKKGNIFLFTPLDCRGFSSKSPTQFCSIRFSEIFLTQYKDDAEREKILQWLKQLEQIFYQHNRFTPVVISNEQDREMITKLIDSFIIEYNRKQTYYQNNLQHLITLILNLLSRNVTDVTAKFAGNQSEEPLINKILLHIRQHIACKEKLKTAYLAAQFNLSENYVGEYFKKITGESLQRYITLNRMKLIEQRLMFSDVTINEIADEFGFTDASHLNSQFKKYSGYNPVQFRKYKGSDHHAVAMQHSA